jgi:Flp pilus assembly pilin Flp
MLWAVRQWRTVKRWWTDESGLGTVEMVLILAVLVGIALIFREYIFGFVSDIMANIMGGDVDAIRNDPVNP